MSATPEVITRYLEAADEQDFDALAACFTDDGVAVDEGETHVGREAIKHWREGVAAKWTFTTTVTSTEAVGQTGFNVGVHIEGDFPGGTADLVEAFTLRDGLIEHLAIG
jgi:ketosteroid isomerase-like protein